MSYLMRIYQTLLVNVVFFSPFPFLRYPRPLVVVCAKPPTHRFAPLSCNLVPHTDRFAHSVLFTTYWTLPRPLCSCMPSLITGMSGRSYCRFITFPVAAAVSRQEETHVNSWDTNRTTDREKEQGQEELLLKRTASSKPDRWSGIYVPVGLLDQKSLPSVEYSRKETFMISFFLSPPSFLLFGARLRGMWWKGESLMYGS